MKILKKINKLKGDAKLKFIESNYDKIIKAKKEILKRNISLGFDLSLNIKDNVIYEKAKKSIDLNSINLKKDEILVFFIANTYLWLDNHDDIHDLGVFKESLNNNFHQRDHEFKVGSRIGDVFKMIEVPVSWRDLGIDKEGETEILIVVSVVKKDYNKVVFEDYMKMKANQHSVGMWYEDIKLAVNNPLNEEMYSLWREYINLIGNKEKAEEKGYFYVVKKGGLREVSYVLLGSNTLTPTIKVFTENNFNENKEDNELQIYKQFLNIN